MFAVVSSKNKIKYLRHWDKNTRRINRAQQITTGPVACHQGFVVQDVIDIKIFAGYLPARYVLAILGSFAMAITYALKVNLSTAMLGMLNHTAIQALSQEHFIRTESKHDLINVTVDQCVLQSDNKTAETIEVCEQATLITWLFCWLRTYT